MNPDQDVLTRAFEQYRDDNYPGLPDGPAFELFSADQTLKQYELTPSEIAKGIVGESLDGGVDGFYVFLSENELLNIDSSVVLGDIKVIKSLPGGVRLDVVVIQAKWSDSWQTDPVSRLKDTLVQLMNRTVVATGLETIYNEKLLERTGIFRDAYNSLLGKIPEIRVHIYYLTKGTAGHLDTADQVRNKVAMLKSAIVPLLPGNASVELELIGASELCAIMRTQPGSKALLRFSQPPIREADSIVGLVKIEDYLAFVRKDGTDELRPGIFESNVRDFSGNVGAVNSSIRETASTEFEARFWWLNNGVTVLADDFQDLPPQEVSLTRPLVVNGLQTTHVLNEAAASGDIPPSRLNDSILVRIITAADYGVRDAVIGGTNRQTSISSIQLHATETLQREIEEYLETQGWYYERRRYQYRGSRIPAGKIVTILELAQVVIAVALGRPDDARARPSTLLNDDANYQSIFSTKMPREVYSKLIAVIRGVDEFLRADNAKLILDQPTNTRYYVAVGYVMKSLRVKHVRSIKIGHNFSRISVPLNGARLEAVLTQVKSVLDAKVIEDPGLTHDQIFKSRDFRDSFFRALTTP